MDILLVDDNIDLLEVMADVLVESGYAVSTARSGAEALSTLLGSSKPPALILCDYDMPTMTGLEFLSAVRSRAQFAGVRAVVFSGTPLTDILGVYDRWILKPISVETLVAIASELVVG